MADNSFGLSFAPFAGRQGYDNAQGSLSNPVQEAIQILSLRRPTVLGASSPVQSGLFGQGTGQPDLSALMQTLFRQYGGQYPVQQLPREQAPPGGTLSGNFPPMQPPAPPMLSNPNFGFQQPGKESAGSGALAPMPPSQLTQEPRDRRV